MIKITIKFGTELKLTKYIVVNHNFTQSSMLYNQRSKQYFNLSKSSFTKKNFKHIDPKKKKHTHTH